MLRYIMVPDPEGALWRVLDVQLGQYISMSGELGSDAMFRGQLSGAHYIASELNKWAGAR